MIRRPPNANGTQYEGAVTAKRSDNNRRRSVVQQPSLQGGNGSNLLQLMYGHAAGAPGWGHRDRDTWLGRFWKQEPMLAGAIQQTAGKYATMDYRLDGPPKTVTALQNVFDVSEHGRGWSHLWLPTAVDYLTQDNNAYIEVVRTGRTWRDPCVGMNHLDSRHCIPTGRWEEPVLYVDLDHREHLLKWWQVMTFSDFPQPEEEARGRQLCAVSRILIWAQIMHESLIYSHEKVSGNFARQVNVFNGVSHREVLDAIKANQENAVAAGLSRFSLPVLLSAMDHRASLSQIVIQLASLPEDWDWDTANRWYGWIIALDLGIDPQDIIPLQSRAMGSGNQSEMLHLKARSKGGALWQKQVIEQLTLQGIVPKNVKMSFELEDPLIQKDNAQLRLLRAQERAVRIKSGELTPEVARQIAVDEGDLDADYLDMLRETDVTIVGGFANDNPPGQRGVQQGSQPGAANMGLNRKDVRPLAQSGFPVTNAKVR